MNFKRIIFALLYSRGEFFLSRNFTLQKVGNLNWLKNNYRFGETCEYVDEIIILLITPTPTLSDKKNFLKDVNKFREKIFVPITLGGGVTNLNDVKMYFDNGADKILINQIVHKDLKSVEKISKHYGSQALSIMVDYKKLNNKYYTFINSGKTRSFELKEYLNKVKNLNFGEIIFNSIDNDGTGFGFDDPIIKKIPYFLKNPILLMGGAGKPQHFYEILRNKKISGAITANLFNFLGKGLELSRNYSINKGLKIIKFSDLNEKNI